jgi:polar amino acid transport system substrate-binding protein
MKKNKLMAISLICFMTLFLLIGCENKDETIILKDPITTSKAKTSEDMYINVDKSVTIVSSDWAPYEFEENGQIKGIGVDIVAEAFNRMGYKVTKKLLPFSRAIEMLKDGEIDVITDVKNTSERQEIGIFSKEAIITTHTSLFVKSDSNIKFTGNVLDLKPYKIGTIRDYSYGEEFDNAVKNEGLKVEAVDDKMQNINKVLDNRLDICIENRLVEFDALKATNNQNKMKELLPELNQTPVYAWFSKKKNPGNMVDEFDKKLAEIKNDGTFERIYKTYIN